MEISLLPSDGTFLDIIEEYLCYDDVEEGEEFWGTVVAIGEFVPRFYFLNSFLKAGCVCV